MAQGPRRGSTPDPSKGSSSSSSGGYGRPSGGKPAADGREARRQAEQRPSLERVRSYGDRPPGEPARGAATTIARRATVRSVRTATVRVGVRRPPAAFVR